MSSSLSQIPEIVLPAVLDLENLSVNRQNFFVESILDVSIALQLHRLNFFHQIHGIFGAVRKELIIF